MIFDFATLAPEQRYKLLASTITPRPIAWVTTMNSNGGMNAAPFSFFNVFGEDPPTVAFAILSRSADDRKDTGRNVRVRREFVVNLVSEDNLEKMNVTAIDFPPDVSELSEAGLTTSPSIYVETPRIAESHVAFECRLSQLINIGKLRSLVLGEVLAMHVRDDAVLNVERAWIDAGRLRLVGRAGPNSYIRTADVLTIPSISHEDWTSRKK